MTKLAALHPTCWICPDPAATWRLSSNPPWGLTDQGVPVRETDFLSEMAGLPRRALPEGLVGACLAHRHSVRLSSGDVRTPGPREKAPRTWAQRTRDEYARMRAELVELLGGECKECGVRDDPRWMRVTARPGLFEPGERVGRVERIRRLLERPRFGILTCADHVDTGTVVRESTLTHKQQVEQAYGGCCRECGATGALYLTPLSGIAVPRWPGGRRYTAPEKRAFLVRAGFPQGWALFCPKHYQTRPRE